LQGKIVHGGTFNGNEEEGKKEETLTVGENDLAYTTVFHWPLERSTSWEAFPFRGRLAQQAQIILCMREILNARFQPVSQ
jgi:hypothetical protein